MKSGNPPIIKRSISSGCCISLTCLKWSPDGELSAFDLRQVIERLARVDQHVVALCWKNPDLEPCPLIS
jgi:hypothetical protein